VVTTVEVDSPASLAGLSAQDELLAVDGTRVAQRSFSGTLSAHKTGDKVEVLYARRGGVRETELVLGTKTERSFKITPRTDATKEQKALLNAWLK
jgi:predicted metalloprotease with PDZ domain